MKQEFDYTDLILEHMRVNSLSQSEMSTKLDVSNATLSNWLGKKHGISKKFQERIKFICRDILQQLNTEKKSIQAPGTITNTAELRECLKDKMHEMGIDYRGLAKLIGYSPADSIKRLLDGKLNFFPSVLSAILAALEIDIDDIPVSNQERMLLDVTPFKFGAILTKPIPVYDIANAATAFQIVGGAFQPVEKYWAHKEVETTPVPVDGRDLAAFRINGNSMIPALQSGDIVLCDKNMKPRNGKIAVVCLNENHPNHPNTCFVKLWQQSGDKIVLSSLNATEAECLNITAKENEILWSSLAVEKKGSLI